MIIHRHINIPLEEGGSIQGRMIGADEWIRYEAERALLEPGDTQGSVAFAVRWGKSWVTGIEGITFDDGIKLGVADVDFLPASFILEVHTAVMEAVTSYLGKRTGTTK